MKKILLVMSVLLSLGLMAQNGSLSVHVPVANLVLDRSNNNDVSGLYYLSTIPADKTTLLGVRTNLASVDYASLTYYLTDKIDVGLAGFYGSVKYNTALSANVSSGFATSDSYMGLGVTGRYSSQLYKFLDWYGRAALMYGREAKTDVGNPSGTGLEAYSYDVNALLFFPEVGLRMNITDWIALHAGIQARTGYYDMINIERQQTSLNPSQSGFFLNGGLAARVEVTIPFRKTKRTKEEVVAPKETIIKDPLSNEVDTDKDGLSDKIDANPLMAGFIDNGGAPAGTEPVQAKITYIDMQKEGIVFDRNSTVISPETKAKMDAVLQRKIKNADPSENFVVVDNISESESSPAQIAMHERQAGVVKSYLKTNSGGIPTQNFRSVVQSNLNRDTDSDGVFDKIDTCAEAGGQMNNSGCPSDVSSKDAKAINLGAEKIQFPTGSSTLTPSVKATLNKVGDIMKRNPSLKFKVSGHTDNTGSEDKNQTLSQDRAQAVADYLTSKGISASNLTSEGYGSKIPVASNDTPAGRTENRRVEIQVK